MKRIADGSRIQELVDKTRELAGLDQRGKALPMRVLPHLRYYENFHVATAAFFACIREVCRKNGDENFAMIVVDPDPFALFQKNGHYPAFNLSTKDSADDWRYCMKHEILLDGERNGGGISFSDQYAVFPDSLAWYLTVNQSIELALLMSSTEIPTGHGEYSNEWVSLYLEKFQRTDLDPTPWRFDSEVG